MSINRSRGYTLIEIVVAVGLFALIMTLASGAYLIMINLNRQAQGVSTGINNLSFALESMTRTIRTGSNYDCMSSGDCQYGTYFVFKDSTGRTIAYRRSTLASECGAPNVGCIIEAITPPNQPVGGVGTGASVTSLTDPSVDISSLTFFVSGTKTASPPNLDAQQPYVTIIVSGKILTGSGRQQDFVVETGAAMRGTDI